MNHPTELSKVKLADDDSITFVVRWRGRQEGPYPASVVEAKLATNEIGLLHEILENGRWVTIREYLTDKEVVLRTEREKKEEQENRERQEKERREREREEQHRTAALTEERRRNDLLAAAMQNQLGGDRNSTAKQVALKPHRATYILFLAILGLAFFGPLCMAAWAMGNHDLYEMDAGIMDPSGRSSTHSGRLIGRLGTVIWSIGFILFALIRSGAL